MERIKNIIKEMKTVKMETALHEQITLTAQDIYISLVSQDVIKNQHKYSTEFKEILSRICINGKCINLWDFFYKLNLNNLNSKYDMIILKELCNYLSKNNDKISINISDSTILHNQDEIALHLSKIWPDSKLIFELLETNSYKDIHKLKKILGDLKTQFPVLEIALDDYPINWCNLDLCILQELWEILDYIKLDNVNYLKNNLELASKFVELIKIYNPNFKVVFEGIEDIETLKALVKNKNIDFLQGYVINKPTTELSKIQL